MTVRPGAVVAWWRGRTLELGVVVRESQQRVGLIGPDGHEQRVPAARIAFEVEPPGPGTPAGGGEAARRAGAAAERARVVATGIDVALVWELAREAGEVMTDADLADLALGERSGPALAATVTALAADAARFVRKPDGWEARPAAAVDEILAERERVARNADERRTAIAALAAAMRGEPFDSKGSDQERKLLDALEQVAVQEEQAPETVRRIVTEVLDAVHAACETASEGAFFVLRRAGRFRSDDENLAILRYGLHAAFSDDVLEAAREAEERGFSREGREDLSGLDVVTIDGPRTREVDDGLSFEVIGDRLRVGIHVADPASFVTAGDLVDREAMTRAVSHYFPDGRIPMIPAPVSEAAASLGAGLDRPALSFFADLDHTGALIDYRIARTIVRSRERLDYETADRGAAGEGRWQALLRGLAEVAERREAVRAAAGAVRLNGPEAEPFVTEGGTIELDRRDTRSAAHRLVSEAMVLAGELAARFCLERRLPAIYRRQPPPPFPLPAGAGPFDDPVAIRSTRRVLKRGEVGISPGPHFALGLAAYVQVTSPLRRYQDLAMHRQIAAALEGREPAYDTEALRGIAATTERAEVLGRRAERWADRYWLLRYLEDRVGEVVSAVVVEVAPRPVVLLEETLVEAPVPSLVGRPLGERVRLRIERVRPRADLLVLRPDTL